MRKIPSILFYTLGFLALSLLLNSCEITKAKKSLKQETTAVSKKETATVDTSASGGVKKTETKSKEEFDWYRMTQMFDQHKQAPGETKVYPSTIVYEGGKGTREETKNEIDSTWFKNAISSLTKQVDSLQSALLLNEKNKQSETKGVGLIMVIIIVVCGIIAWAIISGFLKRFKLIKA